MKNKPFLFCLFLSFLFISCGNKENHLISDRSYRNEVHQDYVKRKEMAAGRREALFSVMDESLTTEEREAMEFLYAYMPLSDLADYDGDYFLDQVRYSFKARDYFSWGKTVPEDIFRHFVLVYRVNNENLDTARMIIFHEIKDRIKDMSMYDAALEVNHWCHEKVTYRPSDGRTSSSLATMKTGYGRCGEESTFTVTAMRAVGIPARQCYTPRWAHTDDNHAWVEVWVDGKWYFLGACEPDAELNMGWFAVPATRTMMVHSNAFGKYRGEEEINYQTGLFARINMLPNYTDTKKITITVLNEDGSPSENADVDFKLYNYAEYYPIASRKSDKEGKAHLTTGLGDLLIWASKEGNYGYDIIRVREQDQLTVTLKPGQNEEYVELLDMNPPAAKPSTHKVPQSKIDENNRRLQYEDSLRNAYLATFMTEEKAKKISNENLTESQIWEIIKKSEGNYAEMIKLMNRYKEKNERLMLYSFFQSLSDKDLRDGSAEILSGHITLYNPQDYPQDIYLKGIISPRIANEGIRPWRSYLSREMPIAVGGTVTASSIMDWMEKNITIDNDANYFNCPVSPRGVFELRYADEKSRDIFFVAACRSCHIPSYKDLATGQLYAYEEGTWKKFAVTEEKTEQPQGTLILDYKGSSELKPEYWIQYTIAKEENGNLVTFDYENDERVAAFPARLELEPGYYLLSTGNRYSDGPVLSRMEFFTISPGQTVSKNIELRPLEPREVHYGTIDLNYRIENPSGVMTPVTDLFENREAVVGFIDPSREPTKHMLKDISLFKNQFEKWNGPLLLVIPSDKRTAGFNAAQWNLPKQTVVLYDDNSTWMNTILESTQQEFRDNYPLVYIIDPQGNITFKSEGYRIGTGELLYKSLHTGNKP